MKIGVCDDEKIALLGLEKHIRKAFLKAGCAVDLSLFQSGADLWQSVLSGEQYDVLFLDIEMPDTDGIDLAVRIRDCCAETLLIFVSNMEGDVFRAFSAHPFCFIRKSHIKEELPKAVLDILTAKGQKPTPCILLETPRQTLRLNPLTILYVECNRKVLNIFTENGICTAVYKISDMEMLLKEYGFIRIHKGYLVNYRYIYSINKEDLTLDNQTVLPVSRGRMADVQREFRRLTL